MYKVFIYDKPVLIELIQENTAKTYQQVEGMDVDKIFSIIESRDNEGVVVNVKDLDKAWEKFTKFFSIIKAGGGVVRNENDEVLLIYRLKKWDLPKGKLEANEDIKSCAIREVEEECNVSNLSIIKTLPITYHCYPLKNGTWALKQTHWYEMKTNSQKELIPQTEEGIEKVIWAGKSQIEKALKNTYASIEEILKKLF